LGKVGVVLKKTNVQGKLNLPQKNSAYALGQISYVMHQHAQGYEFYDL